MMQKIKLLTGLNGVVFLIYSIAALFVVPQFSKLFEGFGSDLPLATRLVVDTYQYWWFVPVMFFILYLLLYKQSEQSPWIQRGLLAVNYFFVVLEVLFIPVMVIVFYLPIFHLAEQI
jgi:type II secretory pathway component PulF